MLKGKLVYIFILFSCLAFGQQKSKMLQASVQQYLSTVVTDYFPTGNSASAGAGEADDVTAWVPNGASATKASVANTDGGGGGSFAVQCNCLDAGFRQVDISVTGLNLTPHTATIRYRITDGTGRIFNWANVSSATYTNLDNTAGTWQVGTATFTPTASTITLRTYPCDNDGTTTGTIEISEIVITEN